MRTSGRGVAVTAPAMPAPAPERTAGWWAVSDALVLARRNLLHYLRVPSLVVFSVVSPVMFVLLFAFVFGGAISVPGLRYVDYLMGGILVQTVAFGSTETGVGLADDLSHGKIDRFRALPTARSAVLAGRALADTIRHAFMVLLMTGVGLLIGFRAHGGPVRAALALLLVLAFGFALSWVSAAIGLAVQDVEATQMAGVIWTFPVTFTSSAFVRVDSMPGWLQAWAHVNPITVTVDAVRNLLLGRPAGADVAQALLWTVAILAVFVPLAVRRYRV
ncbi:MAG: ABC transporter permease [Actinomycetota bacterium]|nr:ABC transporter permease [Actinomycetota bacterium]